MADITVYSICLLDITWIYLPVYATTSDTLMLVVDANHDIDNI